MHIIIDGYNAAHKIPAVAAFISESLEKARNRLIDHLVSWKSKKGGNVKITVVFDGKREEFFCMPTTIKGIRVIYTNTGEEADDRIADMLRMEKDPASAVVVSEDNKVANSCRALKANIRPVSFLMDHGGKKKRPSGRISDGDAGKRLTPAQIAQINKEMMMRG